MIYNKIYNIPGNYFCIIDHISLSLELTLGILFIIYNIFIIYDLSIYLCNELK